MVTNDGFCLEHKKKNHGSLRRLNIRDGSRSQNSQKKEFVRRSKIIIRQVV